jgi:transposase
MTASMPVESPVRGDSHAGFGGRPAETERPKRRHRAAGRPYAATDALDEIRREIWNEARRAGNKQLAKDLKGARFALWKNAENLTDRQQHKLSSIQQTNQRLYRAYLLAQQLRQIYRVSAQDGLQLLEAWLKWARRSRLEPFRKLARRITDQRARVQAAFTNNLSNARVEQINTQIRLIIRRGFGYHSPDAVIALAMLSLGGLCPPLPGR